MYDITVEDAGEFFANGILVHNCDELCAWESAADAWDQLMFTMRLGANPQVVITTTPKPMKLLIDIMRAEGTVVTKGSTYDNAANLPKKFFDAIAKYEGTELGRQELHAEILDLSTGGILKRSWWRPWTQLEMPEIEKVIISFDTGYKDKKEHDHTACTVWGLASHVEEYEEEHPYIEGFWHIVKKREHKCVLLDAWKEKLLFPDLKAKAQQTFDDWVEKLDRMGIDGESECLMLIEDKASGISLIQEFQRAGLPVVPYNPGQTSKLLRAHLVSDILKQGFIMAPGKRNPENTARMDDIFVPFAEHVIEQLNEFRGVDGESDDFVDSCGQAWTWFRNAGYVRLDTDRRYNEASDDDEDDGSWDRDEEREAPY